MRQRKILMPVRTVAEWGGVHEWTIDAARALLRNGHEVTIAGAGEVFQDRSIAAGSSFMEIDWDAVEESAEFVSAKDGFDLIYAHAPQARIFALEVKKRLGIETHVMIHGAYHDNMWTWHDQVESLSAASPSLVHYCQRIGRVDPWKVSWVANAVDDATFEMPALTLADKTANETGHIVTAARLSKDKTNQIREVETVLVAAVEAMPNIRWVIDVYGDGPLRSFFESRYQEVVGKFENADYEMHGWAAPDEIPGIMNNAVFAVTAGMAAVRSVAAGALSVGAGARNPVGLQTGKNLRAGIWSNFGDHGIFRFEPTPVFDDVKKVLKDGSYEDVVDESRRVLKRTNSQSVADSEMLAVLQC